MILTDYGARIQKSKDPQKAAGSAEEFDFSDSKAAKKDRNKVPKMESADPTDYLASNAELERVLKAR